MKLSRLATMAVMVVMASVFEPESASGQDRHEHLRFDLAGGVAWYDISGAGSTLIAGGRVAWAPLSLIALEGNIYQFQYSTAAGSNDLYFFPELSVVMDVKQWRFSPVAGVGAGGALEIGGDSRHKGTLHFLLGLRARLGNNVQLRAELRPRAIDPFSANTADLLLSLGWWFK